jgi:hypothetical protein
VPIEDVKRSGQPSTSKMAENVEKIWTLIHEEHCQTIHELADFVGISYGVCQKILTENLNMRCIATKFVPWLLTNDQKEPRINMYVSYKRRLTRTQLLSLGSYS